MRDIVEKVYIPLTTDTSAMTANDAVTGRFEINIPDEAGFIERIAIFDNDQIEAALDLYLFEDTFTASAINAALSLASADRDSFLAKVSFTTWVDVTSNYSVSVKDNQKIPFEAATQISPNATGEVRKLYGQLATTGTPTYTSTDGLSIKIWFVITGNG